ncbi:MAG: TIGR00730 family Rossman fold protein [Actinomycetota bacterium]|nr:TIGR00730 family Rossman fold protein [Acidimicrobiaceae bacterium]MEC7506695.1 TIGR00730 family Rossman fold protein [Actinomycetota bacterium]MEC7967000.1 TIGR00730 family Rossman fold protein [Actinomycetota bacterium]
MNELSMRYRTGDDELDTEIISLLRHVDEADRELVFEMIVTALRLSREDNDRGDLKLVTAAMKELRYSFEVFGPYRDTPKCTIFGSARIKAGEPAYECAKNFARQIADRDWMVITGAGPGIMEAGHEGAGADQSFGVNIMLPFEASANEYIADDPKLINFKYFFTRKVMFMKESEAYVLLPGGFGTMDESFELLTLIQTGKTAPAPVVLLDEPGGTYWDHWYDFVTTELGNAGLISPDDMCLVRVAHTVEEAVNEVCNFYRTYHSMRFVGDQLVFRLNRPVGDDELAAISEEFAPMIVHGGISAIAATKAEVRDGDHIDLPRIVFEFDKHQWSMLRRLIDRLNENTPT